MPFVRSGPAPGRLDHDHANRSTSLLADGRGRRRPDQPAGAPVLQRPQGDLPRRRARRGASVMIALPLLACALLGGGDTRADAPAASTAFTGATIVDSSGAPPIADGVVVVTGERIAAVGPRDKVAIPAGATLVDLKGKWIIPGLIDAHVHFFQSGGLYTRPDVIDLRDLRPYAEEIAFIKKRLPFARYLACGVTAVADVGGPMWNFEVRELSNKAVHAPRVAVAGPLVSTWQPPKLKVDDPPII